MAQQGVPNTKSGVFGSLRSFFSVRQVREKAREELGDDARKEAIERRGKEGGTRSSPKKGPSATLPVPEAGQEEKPEIKPTEVHTIDDIIANIEAGAEEIFIPLIPLIPLIPRPDPESKEAELIRKVAKKICKELKNSNVRERLFKALKTSKVRRLHFSGVPDEFIQQLIYFLDEINQEKEKLEKKKLKLQKQRTELKKESKAEEKMESKAELLQLTHLSLTECNDIDSAQLTYYYLPALISFADSVVVFNFSNNPVTFNEEYFKKIALWQKIGGRKISLILNKLPEMHNVSLIQNGPNGQDGKPKEADTMAQAFVLELCAAHAREAINLFEPGETPNFNPEQKGVLSLLDCFNGYFHGKHLVRKALSHLGTQNPEQAVVKSPSTIRFSDKLDPIILTGIFLQRFGCPAQIKTEFKNPFDDKLKELLSRTGWQPAGNPSDLKVQQEIVKQFLQFIEKCRIDAKLEKDEKLELEDEEIEHEELEKDEKLEKEKKLEKYTLKERLQIAQFSKNVFDASLVELLSENGWKLAGLNLTGKLEKQSEEKEGKARLKSVKGEFLSFIDNYGFYKRLRSWHDIILQFVSMDKSGRLKLEYEGYDLVPMSDEIKPEIGKLYVKINPKEKTFEYTTINPSGKKVTGIITQKQFKHDIPDTLDELRPFLNEIQKITSERGDTHELKSILCSPVMNIPNIFQWLLDEFISNDKIKFNDKIRSVLNDFVAELNPIILILTWLQANLCAEPDNILKNPLSYQLDEGSFPILVPPKNKPPKAELSEESKYATILTVEIFQSELRVLKSRHKRLRKEHIDMLEPFLKAEAPTFAKQIEFLKKLASDAETPPDIKQKIELLLNAEAPTFIKQIEFLAKLAYDDETPLFIQQKIALLTKLSDAKVSSAIKKEIESLLNADASTFILQINRKHLLMKLVDDAYKPSSTKELSIFTARTFFIKQKIGLLDKLAKNAKLPISIKRIALFEKSWTELHNATKADQISTALHDVNESMSKVKEKDEKLEGDDYLPRLRANLQRDFLPRARTLKNSCNCHQGKGGEGSVAITGEYFNDLAFKTTAEEEKELKKVEVNVLEFERREKRATIEAKGIAPGHITRQGTRKSLKEKRATLSVGGGSLRNALQSGRALPLSAAQPAAAFAALSAAVGPVGTFPALKTSPKDRKSLEEKGSPKDAALAALPPVAGALPVSALSALSPAARPN